MERGLAAYCWLVVRTAWRHSFRAAHSIILALIVAVGLLTYFIPQVEVMIDLHGWQVATVVLASIILVRLVLAPYWIWRDDGRIISNLNSKLTDKTKKQAAIDDLAEEIRWATDNLVNPNPHPLASGSGNIIESIDAWQRRCNEWYEKISKKLQNREFFTRTQQLHFDILTIVDQDSTLGNPYFNHRFNILSTKIKRLRAIMEQGGRA
jgi:hypothetical protein